MKTSVAILLALLLLMVGAVIAAYVLLTEWLVPHIKEIPF